jgi:serine/threonine-protein kinase
MLKAMSRYLERANGRAEAEAWLSSFRMEWNDLEDESRTVPLIRLAQGVKQFVAVAGREAISAAALYLLSPDVLGAWARVLRGSTGPGDALDKLDGNDSELPRTVRWETLRQSRGRWEGRAQISHDPSLEQDGLLRAVRMAEISVLPMLFGLERGVVSSIEKVSDGSYVQEFDVHWKLPSASRVVTTGVLAGGLIGAIPFASAPGALGAAWLAVGAGAGAMVGILTGRDRARRVESASQRTRVQVLERTLLLRDARQSLQSGTLEGTVVAGQFRVVRRMGSGGSGVIYEAVRMSDGLPVAIKLLRAVAAQEAVASDRLRREAEALGLAWHPNVVDVLEHGHLPDGTSYLVMELLRGETLAARLERNRRLLPVELLPIALQVCDALVAVHAAGVVHRDLKPSNIFLSGGGPETDEGEAEEAAEVKVKLIDFGIARVEWEETRITNMGAPIGTPGYMSPEQEAGGVIDARSDVFALGAVLYECLVGETPPPNKAVSWGPPSAPPTGSNPPPQMNSGVRPAVRTVPVAWRAFLSRAMALDPADRFADARTMAQALKDLSLGSLSSLPAAAQAEADDAFNESASSTRGTELGKG